MTLVIGVDAGGTHTRAVIADAHGRELGRAEAPGVVVGAVPTGAAVRAVTQAVQRAAEGADVGLPVEGMWAGMAGAGSKAGRLTVARELTAAGLAQRVVVGTDVEAAYHDAFGVGPGILLIAGTGSIAWAHHPTEGVIRVGGWGEKLGDEGSGYAIGMGALRAVAHAEDGRGPETALRGDLLEHLEVGRPEGLIAWASSASKGDIAALAPLVARASEHGDQVASGLLSQAVEDLTAHLTTVLRRAGPWPEPPGLALWGGLLSDGGTLRTAATVAIADYPVRLVSSDLDPAMGAARMALSALSERGGDV